MKVTPNNVLTIARGYLGYSAGETTYEDIFKQYDKKQKLEASDDWSDAFISICFILAGDSKLIGGPEKDTLKHITKFKRKRMWYEPGQSLKVGDLVALKWRGHQKIAIIETIHGRVLTLIIGDKYGTIGRLRMLNNDERIIGSARPRYATTKQAVDEVAAEVLLGKWGNGRFLRKKLTDAGYDYDKIQRRVCELS